MDKLIVKDVDLKGKRVLVRVDFNVPLDGNLRITDDTRIQAAIPTIKFALDREAKVILMSHLGRPKGKVVDKMRLRPVADSLAESLNRPVEMLSDCVGEEVKKAVDQMKGGDVVLLENLRFHPQEEKNDEEFAKQLAALGQIFVNDAFGAAHRAHASTVGVTKFLPSCSGFLLEKEIENLDRALRDPARPFITILGGAKVSDKIGVIDNLMDKLDGILIGGGMAYTFLKSEGKEVGNSKLEADKVDMAKQILAKAKARGLAVLLPVDNVIADKIDARAETKIVEQEIPLGWVGVDIGPQTVDKFESVLKGARTILWNGPLGIFEIEPFAKSTKEIAYFISRLEVVSIIGGGDTAAAVSQLGLKNKMTHVSTGGGATLEYLEGKALPGISALSDKGK